MKIYFIYEKKFLKDACICEIYKNIGYYITELKFLASYSV